MPLYGPKWPLKSGNEDTFEMYSDIKQQINFYLKNLILTTPGENISDPNYGVGLRTFMFEQNIASVRSAISSRISGQIAIYLPYLEIEEIAVDATSQEIDSGTMSVRITYGIPGDATQKIFELELNPETTIGFY